MSLVWILVSIDSSAFSASYNGKCTIDEISFLKYYTIAKKHIELLLLFDAKLHIK